MNQHLLTNQMQGFNQVLAPRLFPYPFPLHVEGTDCVCTAGKTAAEFSADFCGNKLEQVFFKPIESPWAKHNNGRLKRYKIKHRLIPDHLILNFDHSIT